MKKKILYVDMDDTICKYTEHWINESIRTELEYPQSKLGFYLAILPINGAIESLIELSNIYDVWILSRPSYKNPHCYSEKRIWIERHLGLEWCEKLILCPDKSLMKGDFLVDDMEWPGFEGEQLLFGSKNYPNWTSVLSTLNNNINTSL